MFNRMSKLALRWKISLFAAVFSLGLIALFTANGALLNKVLARKAVKPDSANLPVATALPGDWVNAASMPTARGVAAASLLPSGKVLVVGGSTATQNFITDAAIYDGNTWQAIAPIPIAHRLGAQLLTTGEVLVVGDDDPSSNFPPSSFLYTETPSGWSATNNAPSLKRYQPALALLKTGALAGHVLMTGGYDNNSATGPTGTYKTTELYNPNPANKTWSAGPPMNVGRFLHTATTLNDGRVLVVGGAQRDPLTAYNSAELYTPGGGSWTFTATPMAAARYAHTATLLPSGEVLVVGGVNLTTTLNSVEFYNPTSNTWTTKTPITVARHRHTATLLPSGKVLIAGGQNLAGVQTNSAELYDPATDQWSDAGPMNSARGRYPIAALLSCGRVLVAGGTTANNVHLASAEIYTQKDPLITLTPTTLTNGVVGQTFMQQFSPAGGAAPFTYSLSGGTLPKGMTLQPDGKLTGTPEEPGSFNFTVRATDKNGCMGTVAITWQIACPNVVISPTTLHDGIAGQSYSPIEQLASTGGTAPYSYSVTAGLLPSGMQLTTDGKLQGTPLQTGGFSFTVTVTDKFGCTGMRVYGLTINCGITAITPDVMLLPDGLRGATYAPAVLPFSTVGGCGMNTFTISAGQLPLGMSLTAAGVLTGAPILVGDYTFTVKVTDQCGCMATREYKLKVICVTKNCGCVGPPPPRNDALISWWPMDGNGNDIRGAHHALPQGTGGTFPPAIVDQGILTTANHWLEAPHHNDFNVNQFTLDAWITINQFNTSNMPLVWKGNGTGVAITGSFGLGVSGFPNTVTPFRRLFLDISDGVTFQEVVSMAELPVNVPTHVAATVSATEICLLINGQVDKCVPRTLPPMQNTNFPIQIGGLTGGTVTAPLVQFFNGVIDEVEFWREALTVEELRSIYLAGSAGKCKSPCAGVTLSLASTPGTIPTGMTGQSFPTTMFMASGGTGPYMYSATGLPPGLTLSMDGKLTGIPTQQNTFTVQITVKDANGCTAVFTQPITVNCTPYTIQPVVLPAGTAGKPYPKQTLTSNSPCPTVTYSVTGTLPPGLDFMGGMLQGTPTLKGVYSFTVTATDACGCPSTKIYNMEVICAPYSITPNNLPAGFVGSAYPKQTFTTDSMCPPVTYSILGALPPGLNLDGGMLQGTPSTAGTFTFTVTTVDACGCPSTKPYTIVIKDCPVMPVKLFNTGVDSNKVPMTNNAPDGHYTALTPANVPVVPIVVPPPSSGVDPVVAGLMARWIGRPGIPGGLRYTINFDLSGCDLNSVKIVGRFAANAGGQLFLNSGTTPIATNPAPSILTPFSIMTGFQAGPNKLTFVTAAAAGQESRLLVEITEAISKCCKCVAFTLGPTDLPMGKQDDPYSPINLTASLGMPSYTYSIIGGALPPGMMLSSAGQLSGTPTAKGTFTFTVLVVDAMNCTGTRDYKLVIKKRTLAWDPIFPDDPTFAPEQAKRLTLRVNLEAFGNEKAVSLSLGFNTAILSNPRVTLGADATGATLTTNTSQVAQGAIGMSLTMPGNQTLAEGSRRIFNVEFDFVAANTGAKLDFDFRDAPVARSVTDASGAALPTDAVATPVLLAQPATSVSAASYQGQPLAAEQMVAVFGVNLATATQVATTVPLPTTLAGTTVKVRDSANVERLAPLFFVAPTQINYLIPAGTAVGQATVVVTNGSGEVSGSVVEIANVAPGIFVADASGRGLPAANALTFRADGSSSSRPVAQFDPASSRFVAVPIDMGAIDDRIFLSLFATGVRGRSSLDNVRAIIGGVEAPVSYAGDQGSFAGLDQINIELPRALAGSGLVDVMLIVDDRIANVVQINIK